MSKQIEALKLALEALESDWDGCVNSSKGEAIAAIREALAEQPAPPPECKTDAEKTAFAFGWWKALEENRKQPAQDREPCGWRMKHNGEWAYSFTEDAWDFIGRVPKAQQQEPVAWMHTKIDDVFIKHRPADLRHHPDRWMALYKDPTPCQTCEALARTVMMDQTAHDTPPASKPWVGLTDEEFQMVYDMGRTPAGMIEMAEAILKEKNT